MVVSMTGFGKSTGEFNGKKVTVEVKSLNSKMTDTKVRLPNTYREKELEVRSRITQKLVRGKIDFAVSIESIGTQSLPSINHEVAQAYLDQIMELNKTVGQNETDLLGLLLKMPQVLEQEQPEPSEDEWSFISERIDEAINALNHFRHTEGKELEADLKKRIDNIGSNLEEVLALAPQRIEEKKEKLTQRFAELKSDNEALDSNRFEQELIYYLEKLDITEEKVRLRSHLEYFVSTMNEKESQGKKLGFISQEMGREINTIGSKANHAEMQQIVVRMKDDLEKIKEQLLNVL